MFNSVLFATALVAKSICDFSLCTRLGTIVSGALTVVLVLLVGWLHFSVSWLYFSLCLLEPSAANLLFAADALEDLSGLFLMVTSGVLALEVSWLFLLEIGRAHV